MPRMRHAPPTLLFLALLSSTTAVAQPAATGELRPPRSPRDDPIEPGATVPIEVAWTAHVPRTFARTGAIGNFFFIAQWFPKLGVFEDAGWNCHQFHSSTEFFSDYGVYDVSLTVPAGWVVGATGVRQPLGNTLEFNASPAPART